jgi:ribose transport system permease protein
MGDAYLLIPIAAVVLGGTSLSGGTGGYLGSLVGSIIVVILDALLVSIQVSQRAPAGAFWIDHLDDDVAVS